MAVYIDLEEAFLKWQARLGHRVTYRELAQRAGITLATLNRMKNGELTNPSFDKIDALCRVLGCEPGDIIKRGAETKRREPAADLVEVDADSRGT
jgi:putative transcriptional regulator